MIQHIDDSNDDVSHSSDIQRAVHALGDVSTNGLNNSIIILQLACLSTNVST